MVALIKRIKLPLCISTAAVQTHTNVGTSVAGVDPGGDTMKSTCDEEK